MEMFPLSYVNELCICLEIRLPFFKIQVICFMARDDSPWPTLFQNAWCGWGAWCHSFSFEVFSFSNEQLANRYVLLKTSKGALFLSPCDVYVRSFLYLFNTLKRLYYTKSSERPSLISGPGSNSSPLKAKNPRSFMAPSSNLSLSAASPPLSGFLLPALKYCPFTHPWRLIKSLWHYFSWSK